jgi:hypothetical protein
MSSVLPAQIAGAAGCAVSVASGTTSDWRELSFSAARHEEILLERSVLNNSSEGQQEIEEFVTELGVQPSRGKNG